MRDANGMRTLGIAPPSWSEPVSLVMAQTAAPDATLVDSLFPDYSHWDHATFDAPCFKRLGINRAMVQFDADGGDHTQRLQDAGVTVLVAYGFAYFGTTTQPQRMTDRVIKGALDNKIPIVCFDAEADDPSSPPSGPAVRNAQTRECIGMIESAGLIPWIYSAPWWWGPQHANSPEFAERGIGFHLANYGANDGSKQPIREIGGDFAWTYCVAHQYWSLANNCGRVERDMSYLWSDGLPGAVEGQAMTDDELLAIWAGKEEHTPDGDGNETLKPRAERLALARYRRDEAAAGRAPSVAELASSANTLAKQALEQTGSGLPASVVVSGRLELSP